MSKIDAMPPMCHACPNWEFCEFPYVCPDIEQTKQPEEKKQNADGEVKKDAAT